jgi:hypothetical protein
LGKGQTVLGNFRGDQYIGNEVLVSHLKSFKRYFYNMTEGLDATLLKAVDRDLILKLEEVGVLYYIDMPFYLHRQHEGSITSKFKHKSKLAKEKIKHDKDMMYLRARARRNHLPPPKG